MIDVCLHRQFGIQRFHFDGRLLIFADDGCRRLTFWLGFNLIYHENFVIPMPPLAVENVAEFLLLNSQYSLVGTNSLAGVAKFFLNQLLLHTRLVETRCTCCLE